MSETQEGSSRQSLSGEEPQTSALQGETRYQAAPEDPAPEKFDHIPETAGEISDVVADDKQETNEDSTADEEEPTTWQSSHSPEEQPSQPMEEIDLPPAPAQKYPIYESVDVNADSFEMSGEAADVVQDATQVGSDKRAAHAEEQSLDQAATQIHENQSEKE